VKIMFKNKIIILILLVFTSGCAFTPKANYEVVGKKSVQIQYDDAVFKEKIKQNQELIYKQNKIKRLEPGPDDLLEVGEQITMSIRWWGVEAGKTIITVKDLVEFNGRKAYHLEALAQTSSVVDLVFKVRDVHESFIDAEDLYTLLYVRNASEGRHRYYEFYNFDYKNKKTKFKEIIRNQEKEYGLPEKMTDIISVGYWFRYKDLKVGDSHRAIVHSDQKNYEITFHVRERNEFKDETKPSVFVIEPEVRKGDKIYTKGKGKVLISDNLDRLPLLAQMKVVFAGSLNILLESKRNIYNSKGISK